jgi:hypothetical protein
LPLVDAERSARHIDPEFYYRLGVRSIYKSYTIYAPGHEPKGYMDWLAQRDPEVAFDASRIRTDADWIAAGELAFDAPIGYGATFKLSQVRDPGWYEIKIVQDGKLLPAALAAKKRGVIFDVGHGGGSFAWRIAVPFIKQGFLPDSISTDLHIGSMNSGMKDILNVMDKFMAMGMSVDDVVARSTWNPAREIRQEQLGNLSVGSPADITVLRLEKGTFGFVDMYGARMNGTQNRLTVTDAAGKYHFDEVTTNGLYVVTPSRANFNFSPSQRSFSQLGAHTEATFTASPNAGVLNPLDTTEYFVRQQYLDFLGREPDEAGFNFWVNNIESCGNDAGCREVKRIDTSAAFFLSIEFQQTGYVVYRTYQAAFGDLPSAPRAIASAVSRLTAPNLISVSFGMPSISCLASLV